MKVNIRSAFKFYCHRLFGLKCRIPTLNSLWLFKMNEIGWNAKIAHQAYMNWKRRYIWHLSRQKHCIESVFKTTLTHWVNMRVWDIESETVLCIRIPFAPFAHKPYIFASFLHLRCCLFHMHTTIPSSTLSYRLCACICVSCTPWLIQIKKLSPFEKWFAQFRTVIRSNKRSNVNKIYFRSIFRHKCRKCRS